MGGDRNLEMISGVIRVGVNGAATDGVTLFFLPKN